MNKLKRLLIWLSLYAIPISFAFHDSNVKMISVSCVLMLFALSAFDYVHNAKKLPSYINNWGKCIVASVAICFIYRAMSFPYDTDDIMLVFIPFAILFSSYFSFSDEEVVFNKYFVPLAIITALCGLYILLSSGGFQIYELYREGVKKNQIAPFYAQVAVVTFAIALSNNSKKYSVPLIVIYAICILPILILKARTAFLATMICSFVLFFKKYRYKSIIYIAIFLAIALYFAGDTISDVLYSALIGDNKDVTDMNSLDSGRTDRNNYAFTLISANPFLGSASNTSLASYVFSDNYLIPHNYLLYRTVKYGLLGCLPLYFLYYYVVKLTYKMYQAKDLVCLGCLIIALLESMAEYESPFGPGTTYLLCYLLLGRSLKLNNNNMS